MALYYIFGSFVLVLHCCFPIAACSFGLCCISGSHVIALCFCIWWFFFFNKMPFQKKKKVCCCVDESKFVVVLMNLRNMVLY